MEVEASPRRAQSRPQLRGSNNGARSPSNDHGGFGQEQQVERRIDPQDGQSYTQAEFVAQYAGTAEWDAAGARMRPQSRGPPSSSPRPGGQPLPRLRVPDGPPRRPVQHPQQPGAPPAQLQHAQRNPRPPQQRGGPSPRRGAGSNGQGTPLRSGRSPARMGPPVGEAVFL
jgi:hypothetical protein